MNATLDLARGPGRLSRRQLRGNWRNQLGSELVLEDDGSGGLTGTFRSATSRDAEAAFAVRGCYDVTGLGGCRVLGFAVDWGDLHSVTVWSGRYDATTDAIQATWIMSTAAAERDEWKSTFVGHDVFKRDTPSSGEARTALAPD